MIKEDGQNVSNKRQPANSRSHRVPVEVPANNNCRRLRAALRQLALNVAQQKEQKVVAQKKAQNVAKRVPNIYTYFEQMWTNNTQNYKDTQIDDKVDLTKYKLYIIGDLEGQIHLVYDWFLKTKLVEVDRNGDLKWIADPCIYVIQCGDQLDSGGGNNREDRVDPINRSPEIDLATVMFMDYMQHISKNHVINMIGNHELMNAAGEFFYVSQMNSGIVDEPNRKMLMQSGGLFDKIMKRRKVLFQFNDMLFCHAGVTHDILKMFFDDIPTQRKPTESEVLSQFSNFVNNDYKQLGYVDHHDGPLWTRKWYSKKFQKNASFSKYLIAAGVKKMIIGHNTSQTMQIVIHRDNDENTIINVPLQIYKNKDLNYSVIVTDVETRRNGKSLAILRVDPDNIYFSTHQYNDTDFKSCCLKFPGTKVLQDLIKRFNTTMPDK